MGTESEEPSNREVHITPSSNGSAEAFDLGWDHTDNAYDLLIVDLPNKELWRLIRHFNKQTYHVKSIPELPVRFSRPTIQY